MNADDYVQCPTCSGVVFAMRFERDEVMRRHAEVHQCGTCNGSGIAPDHSPQPDDEQPCPECVP